jgi:hypothetical protein
MERAEWPPWKLALRLQVLRERLKQVWQSQALWEPRKQVWQDLGQQALPKQAWLCLERSEASEWRAWRQGRMAALEWKPSWAAWVWEQQEQPMAVWAEARVP